MCNVICSGLHGKQNQSIFTVKPFGEACLMSADVGTSPQTRFRKLGTDITREIIGRSMVPMTYGGYGIIYLLIFFSFYCWIYSLVAYPPEPIPHFSATNLVISLYFCCRVWKSEGVEQCTL